MTSPAQIFVQSERAGLCDLFDEVGADHPTLCEGWLSHDLALHLWLRENDPIANAALLIKPLTGGTSGEPPPPRTAGPTKSWWTSCGPDRACSPRSPFRAWTRC